MRRVGVVGFGYIGSCVGAVLADKRYQVVGIDSREEIVDLTNRGLVSVNEPGLGDLVRSAVADGRLTATMDFSALRDVEVIIITVGTPLGPNFDPDLQQLSEACTAVAKHLGEGQLVILKSTVPPHATEQVVAPILEQSGLVAGEGFLLAFCPERLAEGRALHEFLTLPVVVGGINEESTRSAAAFWREALDVPIVEVSNPRTAELSKLADNLWIDLSIAVANELAMLSERLDIDVLEVIEAANSLPKGQHNVNILLPSMGVGGSCLTKDPWFVHHLGQDLGLELKTPIVSRTINDAMPRYTFDLIERELADAGKDLETATVAVLGIAFKSNTGDLRFTPTKTTLELLEKSGCDLRVCDPWVDPEEALEVTPVPLTPTIEGAMRDADCIAFLTGHEEFKRLELEEIAGLVHEGCVVLDGRMFFGRDQINRMRELGLRYRGIGR